jgi:hypothetical protein
MVIGPGGRFQYEILIEEDKVGPKPRLIGKGRTAKDSAGHPGLLGYTPDFELSEGLICLRARESDFIKRPKKRLASNRPLIAISFDLGEALPQVIQDGDLLDFRRSGTGDYGFSLTRNNRLILALGAIDGTHLGSEVEVRNDPRLDDPDLFFKHIWYTLKDYRLTLIVQNHVYTLQEGEELISSSYYVYFERGDEIGLPGRETILGIAQLSEKLTRETVIKCTKRFTVPSDLDREWKQYGWPPIKRRQGKSRNE